MFNIENFKSLMKNDIFLLTDVKDYTTIVHFDCLNSEYILDISPFKFKDTQGNDILLDYIGVLSKVQSDLNQTKKNNSRLFNLKIELFSQKEINYIKKFVSIFNQEQFSTLTINKKINNDILFFFNEHLKSTTNSYLNYFFLEKILIINNELKQLIQFHFEAQNRCFIFNFVKINGKLFFINYKNKNLTTTFYESSNCIIEDYYKLMNEIPKNVNQNVNKIYNSNEIKKLKLFEVFVY